MNCLTEYDEEATMRAFRMEGYEDGYTEGERKKAVEAARNLLMEHVNPEIIARCTGLSQEEMQKLTAEIATV